jgi:hypothetical protein
MPVGRTEFRSSRRGNWQAQAVRGEGVTSHSGSPIDDRPASGSIVCVDPRGVFSHSRYSEYPVTPLRNRSCVPRRAERINRLLAESGILRVPLRVRLDHRDILATMNREQLKAIDIALSFAFGRNEDVNLPDLGFLRSVARLPEGDSRQCARAILLDAIASSEVLCHVALKPPPPRAKPLHALHLPKAPAPELCRDRPRLPRLRVRPRMRRARASRSHSLLVWITCTYPGYNQAPWRKHNWPKSHAP